MKKFRLNEYVYVIRKQRGINHDYDLMCPLHIFFDKITTINTHETSEGTYYTYEFENTEGCDSYRVQESNIFKTKKEATAYKKKYYKDEFLAVALNIINRAYSHYNNSIKKLPKGWKPSHVLMYMPPPPFIVTY